MSLISLFDSEIEFAPTLTVERLEFEDGCNLEIAGPPDELKTASGCLVHAAMTDGFAVVEEAAERIELVRAEQRILVIAHEDGLTVDLRDPLRLPQAAVSGSAIMLRGLKVEFPIPPEEIIPGRIHRPAPNSWRAQWRIAGLGPEDVVTTVLDALEVQRSLNRGARFAPAEGGLPYWTGEASSTSEFWKAQASTETGCVLLDLWATINEPSTSDHGPR